MHYSEHKEIVILTDDINKHYSIACSDCDNSVTHKCNPFTDAELHLFGHKYEVDRDCSDSVFILECVSCGDIDFTPFMDDVRYSIAMHEQFHDYVKFRTNDDPDYFSGIDQLMFLWDFIDTLDEETGQPKEYFRVDRIRHWYDLVYPDLQESVTETKKDEV
jgi:hypothetical protein